MVGHVFRTRCFVLSSVATRANPGRKVHSNIKAKVSLANIESRSQCPSEGNMKAIPYRKLFFECEYT